MKVCTRAPKNLAMSVATKKKKKKKKKKFIWLKHHKSNANTNHI